MGTLQLTLAQCFTLSHLSLIESFPYVEYYFDSLNIQIVAERSWSHVYAESAHSRAVPCAVFLTDGHMQAIESKQIFQRF